MSRTPRAKAAKPEPAPRKLVDAYQGRETPLPDYALLAGTFGLLLTGTLLVSRRQQATMSLTDLALLGIATHKISRMIAKDRVTSVLRAPVTRYVEDGEPGEVEEEARGDGLQQALGQLATCPYCLSPWISASLLLGWEFWPRQVRRICELFSSVTLAHLLHRLHAKLAP